MNKTITSREIILAASKELVKESGMLSLNIRDVAKKCDISVGSVYNYFPSKDDLSIATVEAIWMEILGVEGVSCTCSDFQVGVKHFFESVLKGSKDYSFFLDVHAMNLMDASKSKGREVMNRFFGSVMRGFIDILDKDPKVRPDAFNEDFTKEAFVGFVFSNIISMVMNRRTSCAFLLKIIDRTIY